MSYRAPLSPRMLELLSAYLDERLDRREKFALESQLREDAGLRAHLEELRRVRDLLRSLPVLRPPRGLTLTPAMTGARRSAAPPSWPMAFGSALAGLMLLFLLSRDLFVGRLLASATMAPAPLAGEGFLRQEISEPAAADKALEPTPYPTHSGKPPTQPQVPMANPSAEGTPMLSLPMPTAGIGGGLGGGGPTLINPPSSESSNQPTGGEGGPSLRAFVPEITPTPESPWSWIDTLDWNLVLEIFLAGATVMLAGLAVWNSRRSR